MLKLHANLYIMNACPYKSYKMLMNIMLYYRFLTTVNWHLVTLVALRGNAVLLLDFQ